MRGGHFFRDVRDEGREIRNFYLSEEKRDALGKMSAVKRWFLVAWWVLKSMFFKLTPVRRLLLAAGLILIISASVTVSDNNNGGSAQNFGLSVFLGVAALLLVLLLELKDKLLAHGELQDGRAIQRAMQPPSSPIVPGWDIWLYTYPANEVCGDILDFFPFNGKHYGIVTGDVAGKGLGAALLMVKIQALVRAFAPEVPALTSLAAKINEILLRDKIPARFASLLLLQFEPNSGTVRYLNAGHIPPLLITENGLAEMGKGNCAIGLAPDTSFAQKELEMAPGQTLVLYSDGITEAENNTRESFGLERLEAECRSASGLRAQAFGEKLVAAVDAFIGEERHKDDISLVVLQRCGT